MGKVVYLTGAPASGKSSTTRMLAVVDPTLVVWEYGAKLTDHVQRRTGLVTLQDELRTHSAGVVTFDDVQEVDQELVRFVQAHRQSSNIIIDSHPVTKEAFGFRVTPFSLELFNNLAPDEIWVLYASPEVTIERISADAAGRPMISVEEARFHTFLQSSVAATYAMSLGRAVHLFDTAGDRNELLSRLAGRLA